MTNPKIHLDVYFTFKGKPYKVGHGDVKASPDPVVQAGYIASLLHQLAWEYEEVVQREAESEEQAPEERPRVAITKTGDHFYEVAPGEFVGGMSFDDAVETYRMFGGSSSLTDLSLAFPSGIRVDYV
jgi:hypothetical protein